jgi:hypothetical protein
VRKSLMFAFIGVFAALHVILYFLSFGLWRSWAIYLEPIEGIVLGPWAGFSAALMGSIIARMIKPSDVWMFGIIAEPLGALASGFMAKGRWKPVLGLYTLMLTAYFLHPFATWLPLWTLLDILVAFALIYPAARLSRDIFQKDSKHLPVPVVLTSVIGTVTDSLTRVFLLVPVGLYLVLGWSPQFVFGAFVIGAADSYFEDALTIITSVLTGVPLLIALRKIQGFKYPLT